MAVRSFRSLGWSLLLLLVAAGPLAAEELTLQGTWTLDLKASQNVPEAQKGVDLKIAFSGKQLTTARFVGDRPVGEPAVLMLDGIRRPQDVGGQRAVVTARWITPEKSFEHVVSMSQQGSVFATTQTIVTEVSPTGGTLTRRYTIRLARETQERLLVYRRKP
jgi:hypothetical protein